MLGGFVSGLIFAWFLNLFEVGYMIIEAVQPFITVELTISMYYIAMAILGVFGGLIKDIFGRN